MCNFIHKVDNMYINLFNNPVTDMKFNLLIHVYGHKFPFLFLVSFSMTFGPMYFISQSFLPA